MKLSLAIIVPILFLTCSKPSLLSPSSERSQNSRKSEQKMVERQGTVIKGDISLKRSTNRMANKTGLHVVQAVTPTEGWTANVRGVLYKTLDGGESWREVKVDVPVGSYVRSICFVNRDVGWVVFGRTPDDILDYQGSEVLLMQTKDGGQTWRLQYNGKAIEISSVHFISEQEGWIVGGLRSKSTILRSDLLVLHTTDQGEHWEDISDGLNRTLASSPDSDHVMDNHAIGPSVTTLVTANGRLARSDNGGKLWQVIGDLQEPEQSVLSHIGVFGNRTWVVGGAYSIEGIWGLLAYSDNTNSWIKYRVNNVFFKDAVFLTENKVLACGSIPPSDREFPRRGERHGAIFYSADGGQNWIVVYRNAKIESINAMTAVDSRFVWAVGEGGLILQLEFPSETTSPS